MSSNSSLKASDLKGRVHVAIITIRLDEYEAMEERLGAVRGVVGNQIYKFAEIPQKDGESVSVVLTRVVSQVNPSAYRAATDIIHELDPAWIFLVGIAGGVPDSEFSLGDVVLATYLDDFSFSAVSKGERTPQGLRGPMHPDVNGFLSTKVAGADGKRLRVLAGFDSDPLLLAHPPVFPKDIPEEKRYYGPDSHRKKVEKSIKSRFPKAAVKMVR